MYSPYPKCKGLDFFLVISLHCCKASKQWERCKVSVAWATTSWGIESCQYGQAAVGRASKGRGKQSNYCATAIVVAVYCCFGQRWFRLFLLQLLPRACSVPGKLPPSSPAVPTPSPLEVKKKAWAGCLQDLNGEVLFAHTNTFLNHGWKQTNRSLILLTSLPQPYGGVKIPADKIKCCLGLGPT